MQKKNFFLNGLFLVVFSIVAQVASAHIVSNTLQILDKRVHQQTFEAIPNYLGEPYLISNLLANFEQGTTEVTLSLSYDGKTWETVDTEALHLLHRGSYENTQVQFEVAHLDTIIENMKNDEVYFKTSYQHNENTQELTLKTISKKTLQQWYKEAKR